MLRIWIALVFTLASPGLLMAGPSGALRVVDGDTYWVADTKVRLHGIDAPEMSQTCLTEGNFPWHCGEWAKEEAARRFEGARATCRQVDTDRYGRSVARCTVAGADMGEVLVANGIAFAYRKYSQRYVATEKQARARKAGIWASQVETPDSYRRKTAGDTGARQPRATNGTSCTIKGNIGSKGARIYHVPGQKYYAKTKISPQKGERWFCSEAEARRAGWRKSRV